MPPRHMRLAHPVPRLSWPHVAFEFCIPTKSTSVPRTGSTRRLTSARVIARASSSNGGLNRLVSAFELGASRPSCGYCRGLFYRRRRLPCFLSDMADFVILFAGKPRPILFAPAAALLRLFGHTQSSSLLRMNAKPWCGFSVHLTMTTVHTRQASVPTTLHGARRSSADAA